MMARMNHCGILVGILVVDLYIPGALCSGYEVSGIIGGLVATCVIGFMILIAAIVMILVAIFGQTWYMERQASLGICKKPREEWSFFESKLKTSPMSEQKVDTSTRNLASYSIPESRVTTMGRMQFNRGTRITHLPVRSSIEEKTRTMQFEPAQGAFIVTEVLPDATQQTTMRSSQPDRNVPKSTFVDDTKAKGFYNGAVIINDSDDEAGNIPNQLEDIVLF